MATELETRGHDLRDSLWSARILADQPEEIRSVHVAYLQAGAQVVVTASYQVSREGFAAAGRDPRSADEALRSSVRLARDATRTADALVAASVGPYGAILHDGSEYRGDYGVSHQRLVDFHAERLEVLLCESPDLLAIETIPDVDEVEALVDALAQYPDAEAWLTMSCSDGAHTCAGQPVEAAVEMAMRAPGIRAVGINCTAPEYIGELLDRMSAVTDLPLVVYPNAGRAWSPARGWSGEATPVGADLLTLWRRNPQLSLVGGCCGVGPDAIAAIADTLTADGLT